MSQTLDMKKLDLRKNQVLNLKKEAGIPDLKSQVVICLDYSGSMDDLYRTGKVQEAVERLLPLGLAFDDNGEVDLYIFQNNCTKIPDTLTVNNAAGFINNKVYGKYGMGGTDYAPTINQVVRDFGGHTTAAGETVEKAKGLLGKLFGGKKTETPVVQSGNKTFTLPVYALFITDGENDDADEARRAIINASKYGIFWQFVGIGHESFEFLKELDTMQGRLIDNANFFQLPNLHGTTDEDLYKLLLAEFPSWIPLAKQKGLIL